MSTKVALMPAQTGWLGKMFGRKTRLPRVGDGRRVFAVGDIAGVPRGKTAASVKWQVPVVVDNLVAETAGRAPQAVYNGYTSCPMVTGIGKAMLIEFDYDGNLTPSFPFIDPLKELWVSWLIEEKGLKGAYRAMLRGLA